MPLVFLRPLAVLAGALLPMSAAAQDWATRDVCDVPEAAIHEDTLDAPLPVLEAQAAKIPNGVGRFWRITAPMGAVSHLWGTYHSTDRLVLDLPEALEAVIEEARIVAVEIDPVYPTRAEYEAAMRRDDRYLPQGTASTYGRLQIDPRVDGWIRDRLEALGWSRDATDYLTLGALAELLLWPPCEDLASGTLQTQDTFIQTLGHIAGARIMGLEPVDRLRRKLDEKGNAALAEAMLQVYGSYLAPVEGWQGTATEFALYREGRIATSMMQDRARVLALFGTEGVAQLDLLDRWLLDARNRDFVAAARAELHRGGVVIAVGSFHLPGEAGMVALLRKSGFQMKRVPLPGEVPTP